MNLSVSTLACHGWTLEKSLEVCKKHGIQALEIRMGIHHWSALDLPDSQYKLQCAQILDSGLVVSNLGTSVVVAGYQKESLEEIRRCAQIARLLNCRGLRIMLGHFAARRSEPLPEIDYTGLLQWLKEADHIMEEWGTQIWIETHNEFATAKSLMKLLEDGEFKNCRLIWDVMHPLEEGEKPETTIRLMKDMLVHVHVKDGMPWEDPDMACYRYTRLGEGEIPIPDILSMLNKRGYDGFLSLEWEGIWREELRGPGFEPENMIEDFGVKMRQWMGEAGLSGRMFKRC